MHNCCLNTLKDHFHFNRKHDTSLGDVMTSVTNINVGLPVNHLINQVK